MSPAYIPLGNVLYSLLESDGCGLLPSLWSLSQAFRTPRCSHLTVSLSLRVSVPRPVQVRGSEKQELAQAMLPGLQRADQQRLPPPPHRAREQPGQLYESPPPPHPSVPLPSDHATRLHGGYSPGPPANLPPRPNQLLKVSDGANDIVIREECR